MPRGGISTQRMALEVDHNQGNASCVPNQWSYDELSAPDHTVAGNVTSTNWLQTWPASARPVCSTVRSPTVSFSTLAAWRRLRERIDLRNGVPSRVNGGKSSTDRLC